MHCRYLSSPFFALGRGHEVAVQVNGHIHVRDPDAAPAMRTSRLASCVVDTPARLFLPQVEAYPSPLMAILSTCEIPMQNPPCVRRGSLHAL